MSNKEYMAASKANIRGTKDSMFAELEKEHGATVTAMAKFIYESLMLSGLTLDAISVSVERHIALNFMSKQTALVVDLTVRAFNVDGATGTLALEHAIRVHTAVNKLLSEAIKAAPSATLEEAVVDVLHRVFRQ